MGVEPTLDQEAGRATVLKTARPTGTRPPPRWEPLMVVPGCSKIMPVHVVAPSAFRPMAGGRYGSGIRALGRYALSLLRLEQLSQRRIDSTRAAWRGRMVTQLHWSSSTLNH